MSDLKKYVIIVAGGSGSRMKSSLPKQFIPVGEKPILMHTIEVFRNCIEDIGIILVLPEKYTKLWKELCTEFQFPVSHQITNGGSTRFESVSNGLKLVQNNNSIVGVHDGVRPFVSESTINNTFAAAEEHGTAIPVVELNDSIRKLTENDSIVQDRAEFRLVQTPQCFKYSILKKAYEQEYQDTFTDDASVVEAAGHKIELIEGNFENIKITRSFDLAIAELLSKKRFII